MPAPPTACCGSVAVPSARTSLTGHETHLSLRFGLLSRKQLANGQRQGSSIRIARQVLTPICRRSTTRAKFSVSGRSRRLARRSSCPRISRKKSPVLSSVPRVRRTRCGLPPGLNGRVEMWRGGRRYPLNCCRLFRLAVSQSRVRSSVSTSRSSNRTCSSPASGSRTEHHAFTHDGPPACAVRRTSPKYPYRCGSG